MNPEEECKVTQQQARSNLVDPNTPSSAKPAGMGKGKWCLTFSDEFDGRTLEAQKWNNINSHRGARDGATTYWRDSNVHFPGNGTLEIKFVREKQTEKWGHYSSGNINTDCLFEQTYGFFEAKIQHVFPDGKQSAFWMMPNGGTLGK